MFEAVKNWWNKDKNAATLRELEFNARLDTIEARMAEQREKNTQLQMELIDTAEKLNETTTKLDETEQELSLYRKQEEEDEARRNGSEPWVEVRSARMDPVKGIQIELDWNDAFVQYLRENGLAGRDDETIVQKWLAFLYEDLINRLEEKVIERNTPTGDDFL
jgi:chromosome segregation ATPase